MALHVGCKPAQFWRFFQVSNAQLFPQPQAKFDLTKWQFGCHSKSIGSHGWIYLGYMLKHSTLASLLKENPCFSKKISRIVVEFFGVGFPEKLKKPTMTFWVFVGGPVSWTAVASASGRAPSPGRDWPFATSELSDAFPRGFFFPTDRGGNQKLQLLRRTSGDFLKNRSWMILGFWDRICEQKWWDMKIYILRTFFEGTLVVNNLYQTLISGGGRLGKFA